MKKGRKKEKRKNAGKRRISRVTSFESPGWSAIRHTKRRKRVERRRRAEGKKEKKN